MSMHAFEKACGHEIPYQIKPRRAGDVADQLRRLRQGARPSWAGSAEYDLDRMCADSWRWQSMNPDGYGDAE